MEPEERPVCWHCNYPIEHESPHSWYVKETQEVEWFHPDCLAEFVRHTF